MKNSIVWWLGGLLILSLIVIGLSSNKSGPQTSEQELSRPVTQNEYWYGNRNAKVVIVEYGDFQCPACASYASLLKQTVNGFNGQVALVYRHFPLVEIHPRAIPSALVAEAAGAQGKFFEMVDVLYSRQTEWVQSEKVDEQFTAYAKEIGLDLAKFDAAVKSSVSEDKIRAERNEARAMGLSGTPTLFVNGKLISLPNSGEEFQKIIESELAK